jgi:protein-tyrosine phosphatase
VTHARVLQLLAIAAASTLPLMPGVSKAKTDPSATTTKRTFAKMAPDAAGIRRFAEIRPGVTRGGEPYDVGIRYLKDRGYRTVVSFLTNVAESASVVQSGMKYVHIPINSSFFGCELPTDDQVHQFLSVVTDSTRYPIFIHCHAGKDRTGAMSAIYRMEVDGWTPDEAVEEMRSFGFAGRYKNLLRYVQAYSKRSNGSSPQTVAASSQPIGPMPQTAGSSSQASGSSPQTAAPQPTALSPESNP